MTRIAIPLVLTAFLVAYALQRDVRLDVPSNLAAAGAAGGVSGSGKLRTGLSLDGAVQGRLQLTQGWIPSGRDGEVHLVADLRGAGDAGEGPRPPLNLVLVLDRSGSMRAEGKMRQAIHAASEVIRSLRPDDVLGLVSYSTDAELVMRSEPVGDGRHALEQLRGIRPGGSTNISEGLELASREAVRYKTRDRITRVMLLSDGKANHGITDREGLGGLAGRLHAAGISVTSMGLGLTYDELVLQDVARFGGGNYYFLETADTATRAFQAELGGLQAVTARGVQLLVSPREGVSLWAEGGYPIDSLPDGTLRIQLGELSVGEARKAVVRLRFPAGTQDERRPLVRARLSYEARRASAWHPAGSEGTLEVAFTADADRQLASRDLTALARVEEERAAAVLEDVAQQLSDGRAGEAAESLKRYSAYTSQQSDLLADEAFAFRVREVQQMAEQLPRGALGRDEREAWVKRSRARAFSLSR